MASTQNVLPERKKVIMCTKCSCKESKRTRIAREQREYELEMQAQGYVIEVSRSSADVYSQYMANKGEWDPHLDPRDDHSERTIRRTGDYSGYRVAGDAPPSPSAESQVEIDRLLQVLKARY